MRNLIQHAKSLAICMIVKNEQENLSKTLINNVRFSDRTIIVDTGSEDNTVSVAKGLGAETYHFKWTNSFSDARNFSISKADEDWVLWLDADEYIDEQSFMAIRDFLDSATADYVRVPIYECRCGEESSGLSYFREKIFKNHIGAHFIKPVNEQLVFLDDRKASGVDLFGAKICHWGNNLALEAMEKKMKARIDLLKKTAAEYKEDFGVRYLLGTSFSQIKCPAEAMDYFLQVVSMCEKEAENNSLKKYFAHAAHAKRSQIFLESGRNEEALDEALSAIRMAPSFLEPYDCAVMALMELKRYEEALALTEQMFKLPKIHHPVLLFNEQKWNAILPLLHVRALLRIKGKDAAMSFTDSALKEQPDNGSLKQILEKIKALP